LVFADSQPDLSWLLPRRERCIGCSIVQLGEHEVSANHGTVGLAEFIPDEFFELAQSH
jgi:hypothetical protein